MITKQLFLSASGSLCVKGLALILTPITLHFLSPDEFGLFALCNSFITIMSLIFAGGFRQIFWVEYTKAGSDEHERLQSIHDVLCIYLAFSLPLLVVLFAQLAKLNTLVFVGQANNGMLMLCLANCFFTFFAELVQQIVLYHQRSKQFLALNSISMGITVCSSIYFLFSGLGVMGLLWAQILGIGFLCLCGIVVYLQQGMIRNFRAARVRLLYKKYLLGGMAMMPSLLAMWAISMSTRWVLAYRGDLAQVGIYSVVEMVATLFQILILRPLNTVYAPSMVSKFAAQPQAIFEADSENKKLMWRGMLTMSALSLAGYFLGSPLALYILPVNYHAAISHSILMALSQVFVVGTVFVSCLMQYRQKTFFLSAALTFSVFVNAVLGWYLVPLFGVQGALFALLAASLCYFVVSVLYNKYLHAHFYISQKLNKVLGKNF